MTGCEGQAGDFLRRPAPQTGCCRTSGALGFTSAQASRPGPLRQRMVSFFVGARLRAIIPATVAATGARASRPRSLPQKQRQSIAAKAAPAEDGGLFVGARLRAIIPATVAAIGARASRPRSLPQKQRQSIAAKAAPAEDGGLFVGARLRAIIPATVAATGARASRPRSLPQKQRQSIATKVDSHKSNVRACLIKAIDSRRGWPAFLWERACARQLAQAWPPTSGVSCCCRASSRAMVSGDCVYGASRR